MFDIRIRRPMVRIAVAGGTGVVGRHVAAAAVTAGHDVVVLARSKGVDTRTGQGLAQALEGAEVIVDATNAGSIEEIPATEFYNASVANLQQIGAEQGVRHLVVLSIVGIDRVPVGYYAAKLAHERAALGGPLPTTILRATQFHEFAAQMISWNRQGSVARIPNFHIQPVAARTVGEILVEVATGPPRSRVPDLGGPEEGELVVFARRLVDRMGLAIEVQAVEPRIPAGALIPAGDARIEGPTFEQWLTSDDATCVLSLV
jgi:uncharacterized protein YbjT (DUF2867 family)